MKKHIYRDRYMLILALLLLGTFSLWAEANRELSRVEDGASAAVVKNLYDISADAGAESAVPGLKQELELRFDIYNRLFRFDPSLLSAPLKVKVFSDKDAYDRYVLERLGETKPGAIYLHYKEIDRRELVIHHGSPEEAAMLAPQSFLQYFRAFTANPPSWMREGFTIYFSSLSINPQGKPDYEENLLWLESVKGLGAKLPSPKTLLQADVSETPPEDPSGKQAGGAPEEFQISSWALVSFLLNGGQDYFRDLTDSFMLLSPAASAADNSLAVMKRFSLWNDFDTMEKDFKAYLDSRKTYKELLDAGQKAYSQGDLMNAELSFMTARDQRPGEYAPYYYLGLLSYGEKDYDTAEQYYMSSLERGADEALVNYALGINAAAAGRTKDARNYLQRAATLDPAKYKTRAGELLNKLGQ